LCFLFARTLPHGRVCGTAPVQLTQHAEGSPWRNGTAVNCLIHAVLECDDNLIPLNWAIAGVTPPNDTS
jgi:hypothetical protein